MVHDSHNLREDKKMAVGYSAGSGNEEEEEDARYTCTDPLLALHGHRDRNGQSKEGDEVARLISGSHGGTVSFARTCFNIINAISGSLPILSSE